MLRMLSLSRQRRVEAGMAERRVGDVRDAINVDVALADDHRRRRFRVDSKARVPGNVRLVLE